MKNLKLVLIALLAMFTFASCSNDDDGNLTNEVVLSESEIPSEIQLYVTTHFPSSNIELARQITADTTITYDILLTDNSNLVFSDSYDILLITSSSQLPNTVIPQAILDYVAEHYPNNYITEWEIEDTYQEVELDNDIELEFTLDGVFIRVDMDDDENDDEVLAIDDIPSAIMDYISTHFPSNTIVGAWIDSDDDSITYEINLSGTIELEFNDGYQIISIETDTQLPNSVIPQNILDYVSQNYPNNVITSWELDDNLQQIELNNGLELDFDLNGAFVGIGDDDDDDYDETEEVIPVGEIPSEITTYINTHFPSNSVVSAIMETEGTIVTYDITLTDFVELEFNSLFEIIAIDSEVQLPDSVIPQAILNYVTQNYPNNFIVAWELETNEQQIELNNNVELIFTLDGVFVGVDND